MHRAAPVPTPIRAREPPPTLPTQANSDARSPHSRTAGHRAPAVLVPIRSHELPHSERRSVELAAPRVPTPTPSREPPPPCPLRRTPTYRPVAPGARGTQTPVPRARGDREVPALAPRTGRHARTPAYDQPRARATLSEPRDTLPPETRRPRATAPHGISGAPRPSSPRPEARKYRDCPPSTPRSHPADSPGTPAAHELRDGALESLRTP